MAMDQTMPKGPRYYGDQAPEEMPPRGRTTNSAEDQEGEEPNGKLSGSDCLMLVQRCLAGLDPEERDNFVEGLSNLLQSDQGMDENGVR
jgi:hypothetical protein